jgi:putative inorganic carbon (hco3(-)) transporter
VSTLLLVLGALGVAVVGAAIGMFVRPAVFFSLALGASVLSGNWGRVGSPIALDRVLVLAGLGALVLGVTVSPRPDGRRRFRAVEISMVLLIAVALGSAVVVGTLTESTSFYGLLDRLGIVPFVAFIVADRIFANDDDRRFLVGTMMVVGAYLAVTAVFEMAGASALVFPKYINNPNIGTHWGRARGPFLEAGANGLALFECGVAAAVGLSTLRTRAFRVVAAVVIAMCAVGILLTLTRADWIGAAVGAVVGCLLHPRARRLLVPLAVLAAVGVAGALLFVPGLGTKASERTNAESPLWDRKNTNATAVRMVEAHPLFGVGWNRFVEENVDVSRQADGYPLSNPNIGVHNVFLSYAAEIGLIGALLWATTVVLGVSSAWSGGASLDPVWRAAAMAIFVDWFVVGNLQPLAFAFPNLCVWLWLGIAAAPTARHLVGADQVVEVAALDGSAT